MQIGDRLLHILRVAATLLPGSLQEAAWRFWSACQIRFGRFGSPEPGFALEPVPETFAILADNCRTARCRNVTLINAVATQHPAVLTMTLPNAMMPEAGMPAVRSA